METQGNQIRTRSYEPFGGAFTGYCIQHAEAYSIADYLRDPNGSYTPTVYYSYLISDTAKLACHYMEYSLNSDMMPESEHVLRSDEIISGYDSCGVLCFFKGGVWWVGHIISNDESLMISPEVNGTCLQVGIHILASIEWMIQHPEEGVIEPEHLDSDFIVDFIRQSGLGHLVYSDVTKTSGMKCQIQFTDVLI